MCWLSRLFKRLRPPRQLLIPTNELSLNDIENCRAQAIEAGKEQAVAAGAIPSMDQCVVRHAEPVSDFEEIQVDSYRPEGEA